MALVNLNTAYFPGLQDTSGNGIVLGTSGSTIQLHPRNTEPPALPTLTGAIINAAMFHNEQDPLAGNFNTSTGTPAIGAKGLQLTAGSYISRNQFASTSALQGTWWADGIMNIEGPLSIGSERYIVRSVNTGALLIDYIGGSWRFVLENVGSDASSRATFDSINIPITNPAVDAVPKPFYIRLLREFPSSATGEAHLVINDGTTTQTQTLTGLTKPATSSTSTNDIGFGDTGTLNFFYFRQTGTNTAATVGALQGTYWTTPTVYSSTSYFTTGPTSSADAGTDDQYWHELQINSATFNNPLRMNGGGILKMRSAASNTAPTGNTSADFSGTYGILQNIPISLNDVQGRYLKLEWRFEPGSTWPLQSDSAFIFTDNFNIASASHFATSSGSQPVTLPVSGEGESGGTLPFIPEVPVTTTLMPRVSRFQTDYPYSIHRPLGTKIRRSYSVSWILNDSDASTLVSFFDTRRGGEEAFTWTAPGDDATSKAALEGNLNIFKLAPSVYRIQGQITEVF